MSPTRRDLLKFASAGAFLASLPTTDVAAAMRSLEVPIATEQALDPGTFAQDTHNLMATYNDLWYSSIAPEEWAEYRQAMDRLHAAIPALRDPANFHVFGHVDAAITNLICESHRHGLRQGARFEHLRQALVVDTAECRRCWGSGAKGDAICGTCAGAGVVPFAEGGER